MKINKTNRVVGFTSFHLGFRKSSPVNFDNIFHKLLIDNSKVIEDKFPNINIYLIESCTKFREVYSGSPDSNTNHLKEFLKDNSSKIFTNKEIIDIVLFGDFIQVPKVSFNNPLEMIYCVNYNKDSSNGLNTSRLLKSNSKGYSIDMSTKVAIDKFKIIKDKAHKNYCLWEILSREKDFDISKVNDEKKLSTRVVMSTEHHETILLTWIIQKFMDSYELFTKNKGSRLSFDLSGEFDGEKAYSIKQRIKKFDYYLDADWSAFDSTISTQELEICGFIMFSECVTKREDLRVIFHVISSFCTKYIAIPPGIVVELNKGNPSGHPGVTAINCFVNLIRWSLIGFMIYGENYSQMMDIIVYGDDAIIAFKDNEKLWQIDSIIKKLNFKSDELSTKLYPVPLMGLFFNEGPDFLKRRFTGTELSWNIKKVLDKIIYQSKIRTVKEQLELAINYVETAPGSVEFNNFIKFLVSSYIKKNKVSEDIKDLCNRFLNIDKNRFIIKKSNNILKNFDLLKEFLSYNIQLNKYTVKNIYKGHKFNFINKQAKMLLFGSDFNPNIFNKNKEKILNKIKSSYNNIICVNNFGMVYYNRQIFEALFRRSLKEFKINLGVYEKPT